MLYQQSFFEKTAIKYPEAIAVDDHGKQFTYDHLEKFSNKIANFLSNLECSANDRACILLDKGFLQIFLYSWNIEIRSMLGSTQ